MHHQFRLNTGLRRLLLLGILSPCALPALSDETGSADDDFLDLSLDELSNFSVTVASTRAESISTTPAIVSRYSPAQLKELGIHSLKDMLSFVPGVVTTTALQGHQAIMIRGLAEAFNQKVLFLIDDVPYWMPTNSDIPMLGIPMEAIDHIEVIRGPGAVYYGTNASAGVVKVVTRKADGNNSLAIKIGSNNLYNGGGFFNQQLGDQSSLSVAFEAQKDGGYYGLFENMVRGTPPSGLAERSENYKSLLAHFVYQDFNASAQAFTSETEGLAPPGSIANKSTADYRGFLVAGDYTWHAGDSDIKVFSDYSDYDPEFRIDNFFGESVHANVGFHDPDKDNYRWRSGVNIDYRLGPSLSLFAGAEHEKRAQGDFSATARTAPGPTVTINPEGDTTENSLYGQADYTHGNWRYLLGLRWVDNEYTGSNVMPRLSAIYHMDKQQSIKLLYSTGFNSPNFLQSSANASGIVSANATAETIESLDLAYTYAGNNTLFVANAYYLTLADSIQRTFSNGIIAYTNGEDFDRYGAELDYQRQYSDVNVLFNLSYNHQGNKIIHNDPMALFVPRYAANLGVSRSLGKHIIGGVLQFTSERAAADSTLNLNLNYQYEAHGYEVFAALNNVLDDDMKEPDLINLNPAGLAPGSDGRTFLVGLKINF